MFYCIPLPIISCFQSQCRPSGLWSKVLLSSDYCSLFEKQLLVFVLLGLSRDWPLNHESPNYHMTWTVIMNSVSGLPNHKVGLQSSTTLSNGSIVCGIGLSWSWSSLCEQVAQIPYSCCITLCTLHLWSHVMVSCWPWRFSSDSESSEITKTSTNDSLRSWPITSHLL